MNRYVQFTAGRGPVECARAVAKVAQEFCKHCRALGLEPDPVDAAPHNAAAGCFMSLTFRLSADEIPPTLMADWQGTVLWTATANPFRPGHRRKNWFVGVSFFDELELPAISDADITYETSRSGGKGGQNVNKVETAVRAIHIPTGTSVRCTDERSQAQNKERARQRLLLKLRELQSGAEADERTRRWQQHDALERGNPVKKFSGPL